ncbi:hypothetical protein HAX54_051087 [Datura stramonium]|uniref:Putative plant transposon protein domain-containing protein n=1 Tax=Datura stramonium TaxID=4076 RepID=A0ABS8WPE5_DATST|nr:hypothetical protein [Datura stramonium]
MVDISEATITRMLCGPNFTLPINTTEFDYRMRERHEQRRWLAQVLTDGGANTLAKDRAVLVASLMSGFSLNIKAIIFENFNWRVVKLSMSLPFPCLITHLCREAHVPILVGIDGETNATKKYDLEKSKDESRYDLKLHKKIRKVFGPSGQTAREMKTTTELSRQDIGAELVCHATLFPTSTPSTSSVDATQPRVESAKTSSAMP